MGLRVYEYGLLQPLTDLQPLTEQLRGHHNHYNKLVEINRECRKRVDVVQRTIPELSDALDVLNAAIAKSKQAAGKTTKAAAKKELEAAKKEVKRLRTKHSKVLKPLYKPIYAELDVTNLTGSAVKAARKACTCYWGSYLLAEKAAQQASKDAWGKGPKFRRWIGEGSIGVQTQNGLPCPDVFNSSNRLVKIDPIPAEAWDKSTRRCQRDKLQRTVLHMRIGSQGRDPIWASWPLFMHRQLPTDGKIKWVTVIRRRRCHWYRWVVQFSVEVPDVPKKSGPMVALNLGWRKREDGLRAAFWVGDDGRKGELIIPYRIIERSQKADELRSVRDQLLNELKAWLCKRKGELPAEVRPHIHTWRKPARFVWLQKQPELPEYIEQRIHDWRGRDLHLWQYETGCRKGALNQRREVYRLFAKERVEEYGTFVIESYNMTSIVEDVDRKKQPAHHRFLTSNSQLRGVLESAAIRVGGTIIKMDDKAVELATQTCALCGYVPDEPWDAAPDIEHTCEQCGETWDQDENNALNLLTRAKVAQQTGKGLKKKNGKKNGRFKRRKKHDPNSDTT